MNGNMAKQDKTQWSSMYVWMLLVPLFWGGSFATAKHVVTEIPPLVAATIRFGMAGMILALIVTIRSVWKMDVLKVRWKGLLFIAVTGIFGYNALFFVGLHYTSVINGSLIIATMPVFTALGAVLFLKESWSGRTGLGLILTSIGVLVVITEGSLDALLSSSLNIGDLMFVAALICGVLYSLAGKAVMKDVSPLLTTTLTTLFGSLLLLVSSLLEGGWERVPHMSWQGWQEMLYMVVCGTLVGYIIFNKGVEQIGAMKASMYLNLVPIVATLASVVLYGSTVAWQQLLGMIIVLSGLYIAMFAKQK
ncbi:DMT family transporter [Paenibacillus sp. MER TA 81-3]|uniref:DMT family transporter n=1 Tax=Paenibacillus sp. MER TA 81-3 TaxID=2939573 RepID=UPI002040C1EB|nr:DMT family transporter [Paenibacillus sp. MER TA 81-3]MCM3341870.1 DMT family transporter [Paenibacillus sp. MER TA 81-3]